MSDKKNEDYNPLADLLPNEPVSGKQTTSTKKNIPTNNKKKVYSFNLEPELMLVLKSSAYWNRESFSEHLNEFIRKVIKPNVTPEMIELFKTSKHFKE
jgi:hypothetical protein